MKLFFFFADSESADLTVPERDTIVELSSLDSSKRIVILLRATGVANKRNRTVDLHLVPVTPFNQSGTVSLESITLTIPDLDSELGYYIADYQLYQGHPEPWNWLAPPHNVWLSPSHGLYLLP